ncbi:hypothetical protein N7486_003667 [Penicillium sp. IBT 16267x]|nr:hypothetical protein N7486_003667 [Penicillium sp. IBT 16267x]
MILSRRAVLSLGLSFFVVLFFAARHLTQPWSRLPQAVGLGDFVYPVGKNGTKNLNGTVGYQTLYAPQPNFVPGIPKPPGVEYSKRLVVPRTKTEDVSWIDTELPDWDTAIYVANDPHAPLHPPSNKGHEVMVYLTYVIDYYDDLSDISVFIHSHQNAWHNDEIFGGDTAEMLRRLNLARVTREGYMNLRCGMAPGCPAWMHPGTTEEDEQKQEELMLARAWGELFPDDQVPSVLAQPCCAQFALSRERIRTIPRARFVYYRDWLLQTDLSDYIAGRIWEYLWQYVFTGEPVVCVEEHICLCDGYGICFGGPDEFQVYRDAADQLKFLQQDLSEWSFLADDLAFAENFGELDETMELDIPPLGRESRMKEEVDTVERKVAELIDDAMRRGEDPKLRALEAGRPWQEGDGS